MQEPTPIKRSAALAPLSREHHTGLQFVLHLRTGLKNGVSADRMGHYIQWFWDTQLNDHFKKEEQVLAPLDADEELVLRMIDEHQEIEAMIHINESIPDVAMIEMLANLLHDNIRFEERMLFSFLENKLSAEALAKLGDALADETACEKWRDEFWLEKNSI